METIVAMKVCPKCRIEKSYVEFNVSPKTKDGLYYCCKFCRKLARLEQLENRHVVQPVLEKTCRTCFALKSSEGFYKNRACKDGLGNVCKVCTKIWQQSETGKASCRRASRRNANTEKGRQYSVQYRKTEARKIAVAKYDKSEKGEATKKKSRKAASKRRYWSNRYRTDLDFRLRVSLRSRIKTAVKKDYKTGSAVKDLGCSIPEFKKYLESLWQPGMTWENWSRTGWHIDHIVPLASFDLKDPEQYKKAVHYTNQQPLWAVDNLKKGDR